MQAMKLQTMTSTKEVATRDSAALLRLATEFPVLTRPTASPFRPPARKPPTAAPLRLRISLNHSPPNRRPRQCGAGQTTSLPPVRRSAQCVDGFPEWENRQTIGNSGTRLRFVGKFVAMDRTCAEIGVTVLDFGWCRLVLDLAPDLAWSKTSSMPPSGAAPAVDGRRAEGPDLRRQHTVATFYVVVSHMEEILPPHARVDCRPPMWGTRTSPMPTPMCLET